MEFRSKAATFGSIILWLGLLPAAFAQQKFEYKVKHEGFRKGCEGALSIDEQGVSFAPSNPEKKKCAGLKWAYQDIQQLEVSPDLIRVLTYQDRKWRFGADQQYTYALLPDQKVEDAYRFLRDRLDQRFVAEVGDTPPKPVYEVQVKHLRRIEGSQGVLLVGDDRVVFQTETPGESRTWRYADIENVSSSGPFQLTITTFERAKAHYGDRKGFNFQLKQPLNEAAYNFVWKKVNQAKGLSFLSAELPKEKNQ